MNQPVERYIALSTDRNGDRRVKAVVSWNRKPSSGNLESAHLVSVKTAEKPERLVDRLYINGELVHRTTLLKRERIKRLPTSEIRRIVWCYHDFNYGNSLSHIGRESVRWLRKQGIPTMIRTWDGKPHPGLDVPVATDEDLKTSAVILMDRYPVKDHIFTMLKDVPFLGGYYMLEGTRTRTADMDRLDGYDVVFTPSEFCKKALLDSGIKSHVVVWGHGFDHEVFSYVEPKPDRPFTFLWFGDENRRKGYDLFLQAFSRITIPNVRAWVHGPGSGGIAGIRQQFQHDSRIVWDTTVVPPEKLRDMMAEVDVLVAPFRGEGFGLTILESMASGRAVIATKWSGPLDFAGGDDLTYWISVQRHEPAQNDEGIQVVPNFEELVARMSYCATHPEEVRARGKAASAFVGSRWRWDQKVMEVLPVLRKMVPNCKI